MKQRTISRKRRRTTRRFGLSGRRGYTWHRFRHQTDFTVRIPMA